MSKLDSALCLCPSQVSSGSAKDSGAASPTAHRCVPSHAAGWDAPITSCTEYFDVSVDHADVFRARPFPPLVKALSRASITDAHPGPGRGAARRHRRPRRARPRRHRLGQDACLRPADPDPAGRLARASRSRLAPSSSCRPVSSPVRSATSLEPMAARRRPQARHRVRRHAVRPADQAAARRRRHRRRHPGPAQGPRRARRLPARPGRDARPRRGRPPLRPRLLPDRQRARRVRRRPAASGCCCRRPSTATSTAWSARTCHNPVTHDCVPDDSDGPTWSTTC